ncbi:MAG: nucleoside hydrolase [Candidatus ainarchaeum sp.]|nr:nucleoside hydrolase [Candidatus ainarchaeum sp.]
MKKIIIDTDPGHDDALAIMLAEKSRMFDILAITTVAGNTTIEKTTRNAKYVLDLLDSKIPLYSGSEKPIKRELIKAVVHGESGLAGIDPEGEVELTNNAVDMILKLVKENPEEITLVTLGPLTNIARAIQRDPDVMKKVVEIVAMGGAIKVPGNKNRVAEFNFFVDPEAADIVFRFPVKKTIVPLDACNRIKLSLDDFKKIKNQKIRGPVLKMMGPYIENITADAGVRGALMYDPLTVYYLINPDSAKTKIYDLVIETKGEFTSGMCVLELRKRVKKEKNILVVEKINRESFKKDFIEILGR